MAHQDVGLEAGVQFEHDFDAVVVQFGGVLDAGYQGC